MSLFSLICLIIVLSGCNNSLKVMETQTDTELFEEGRAYYEQGEHKKALQYFLYVKEHFLRGAYAGPTRFYAGECYFAMEDYTEAAIEYKSFLSFFPNDPNAAAAQYKLGICYLEQSLGPDRDQEMIQNALTELEKVRLNYPDDAEYITKTEEKITQTKNELASHEFMVAEFYRKEKHYTASNRRLAYLIKEYPDASVSGDAVFTLGLNYLDLQQPEDAQKQFLRLLQYYPDNQYVSEAKKKLAQQGISDFPEPSGDSPGTTPAASEQSPQPSSLSGYIVLKRDNTVFTDLIRDDGVKEGMLLHVYRGNTFIGTIRIIEIQEGFSIGEIDTQVSNETIKEEDQVILPE